MHVLFQRDNSNITIMRDCSSDYKDAIYLSTYIAAALEPKLDLGQDA